MKIDSGAEIVLVEDNPSDAELTLRALRDYNLANSIELLEDGEQALDYIRKAVKSGERPKLIILDLKLPKIDGLEVLKHLKENETTRTIPVVVLTSSQHESDLITSYRYGANSYITKPVEFDKFVESVKQLGLYWLLVNRQPEN